MRSLLTDPRKAIAVMFIANGLAIVATGVYVYHGMQQMQAEHTKELAANERAISMVRQKIYNGEYAGMTQEQIERAVRTDFEFFRIGFRIND